MKTKKRLVYNNYYIIVSYDINMRWFSLKISAGPHRLDFYLLNLMSKKEKDI